MAPVFKIIIQFLSVIVLFLSAGCSATDSPKTFRGTVYENNYHLNLGIGLIYSKDSGIYYYDSPHSDAMINFSITVNHQGQYYLVYYIDDNNNGYWDYLSGGRNDSYFYLWPTPISVNDNSVKDITLSSKLLIGTNGGQDVSNFNRIYMNHMIGTVNNAVYSLRYYMMDYVTNNNAEITLFQDSDNNYALDAGETAVYYPATNFISGTNVTTNSINFIITRTIVHITTNGSASGYAHPKIIELAGGRTYPLQNSDITNYWNRGGTNAVNFTFGVFNDENNNGRKDVNESGISTNNPVVGSDTSLASINLFVTN
jgi:hypothetical protein